MPNMIRLRNVVREEVFERRSDEPILRVPYDLFQPDGAARMNGELAQWREGGIVRTGRVAPGKLGDTAPGERVLLRDAPDALRESPNPVLEDDWWLCEVEVVNGKMAP
jgi:hypothetical protein